MWARWQNRSSQKLGPLNPTWQHCPRNFEPERLSSLEVDGQLVLGWRLHGEVFRLGTLENAVDIRRRLGKLFGEIASISNQTASLSEFAPIIYCRSAVAGRQQSDVFALASLLAFCSFLRAAR